MRRCVLLALVLLLAVPWTAEAGHGTNGTDSVVSASTVRTLATFDLGLETMGVSPDGQQVLLAGSNGFSLVISTADVAEEIELNSGDDDDLQDLDWHPRGETALIVGDGGTMLRYAIGDHSVTHVAGSIGYFQGKPLSSIAWDAAGGWAYVGSPDGSVTRYRENANGNGEFFPLNDTKGSAILDISCHHKMHSLCVVATESDGMAVINADHQISWMTGSEGTMWRAVECPHPERDRCFGAGQGSTVGVVELDLMVASDSYVLVKEVNIGAEFTGFHVRNDGNLLIQTAPFGWIDWNIMDGTDKLGLAYPWLYNEDLAHDEPMIAGESIIGGWASGDDTGFAVTSFGRVVQYAPLTTNIADENIVVMITGLVIAIAVPGSVIGLIFMMNPKWQRKYRDWSNARIEARNEKRRARRGKH